MMDNETRLRSLAERGSGLHYASDAVKRILDAADWAGYWPIVDGDGLLTGDIVGSEEGYYNVNDMAMVHIADLSDATQAELRADEANGTFDGYVIL